MHFQDVKEFVLGKLKNELSEKLTYHSLEHIKDVYSAAERLAAMENVTGEELYLLLTAVLFHDIGFLETQKDHEQKGCELARHYLPSYDYTPEQMDRICGMIMATRIPQTPHNKLEMIICDADLDYLGREDFFTIGNKLFAELRMYGIIGTMDEWNKLQDRFLSNHAYFTESAKSLRAAKKAEHLDIIRSKIK